jgi:hypothetical protein
MTRKQSAMLDQMVAVAGDPAIVEEALRALQDTPADPRDIRTLVRKILEIRQQRVVASQS